MTTATQQFEVGATYQTRSIGDHNCIIKVTVLKRTKCFITTTEGKRFKVNVHQDVEGIRPWGSYSMCPYLKASDTKTLYRDWENGKLPAVWESTRTI